MALTKTAEILGQDINSGAKYCYLYEPLRVTVGLDATTTELFIDLEIIDSITGLVIEYYVKYAIYDVNSPEPITVDLMELARQHHDADTYVYSNISDMTTINGSHNVVSKVKYHFKFHTVLNPVVANDIQCLPIIGGRDFFGFVAGVDETQVLNEFDLLGISQDTFETYPYLTQVLVDSTLTDVTPTITEVVGTGTEHVCAAYVVWKSRYGGWCTWGFDLKTETQNHSYIGKLETGMFKSTSKFEGEPYVPVNYTGVSNSRSVSLKSIGRSSLELKALAGISASPAVYLMKDISGDLELMRLGSVSAPQKTEANGGDFTITLSSISKTIINTK